MKKDLQWEIADVRVDNFDSMGTMSYRARAMIPMLQKNLQVRYMKELIIRDIQLHEEYSLPIKSDRVV